MKTKQDLIDELCQQIQEDAVQGDTTVLDAILQNSQIFLLIQSLPEEAWSKFDGLLQADRQEQQNKRQICWWSVADVEHVVKEHNEYNADDQIEYTDGLAHAVLDNVEDVFDANYGVCWDTLRNSLETMRDV
jgi:hypothetical protein